MECHCGGFLGVMAHTLLPKRGSCIKALIVKHGVRALKHGLSQVDIMRSAPPRHLELEACVACRAMCTCACYILLKSI